jgi:hypothetical protein
MAVWSVAALAAGPKAAKVAPMPGSATWCLQPPNPGVIVFHGLDETEAGREGPDYMMYPVAVPGLAGALASLAAGIAAHGAVVGGMQAKHASERAQKADQILLPYRATLEKFTTDRLTTALLAVRGDVAACPHSPAPGTWLVSLAPQFYLSQSKTTVIAEIVVAAVPVDVAAKETPRMAAVRVVSDGLQNDEFADQWLADDATGLSQHAALLVSQALDVAIRWEVHEAETGAIPWATYRFALGGREHMERAQRVSGDCHSSVLRTLRAAYIVASMEVPDCEPSPPPALTEKRD